VFNHSECHEDVSICLIKHHIIKTWVNGGIAPLINLPPDGGKW